jgi:hypothetical protein
MIPSQSVIMEGQDTWLKTLGEVLAAPQWIVKIPCDELHSDTSVTVLNITIKAEIESTSRRPGERVG